MRSSLAALAPLAVTLAAAAACAPAHAGPGAAAKTPTTTEVRATGDFHGISISTVIEVEVTIGKTTRVELEAPAAWLPKIDTTVKDGVLEIATPKVKDKLPKLKARITTPEFRSIAVSGVATVSADDLKGKRFDVSVSGVATLALAGAVDALRIQVSGSGELRAKDLVSRTAAVSITGTGELAVHATETADVSITGVGNIAIYGKPAVRKRVTGAGTIALK
jgi:hypothetical protein